MNPPDEPRRPSSLVSIGIGLTGLMALLSGVQLIDRLQNHQTDGAIGWFAATLLLAFQCVALIRRRNHDAGR
jgi:hypothetical protein